MTMTELNKENEIISKWFFPVTKWLPGTFAKQLHYQDISGPESWRWLPCPSFDDPAAWTPELFQAIEDAGLKDRYLIILMEVTMMAGAMMPAWAIAKATPAQKATALARAIQEVS